MASSSKAVVPIILIVTILCTIGVIYGGLEMSDSERSAFDVLQDLFNGKLTLKDIWDALTTKDAKAKGTCVGRDLNGVYQFDDDENCIFKGCKIGYYPQNENCIEQRDISEGVYGGTIPVDCEISGYTYSMCRPKVNRRCGTNSGTKQKYPTIIKGAIANGSCEGVTEVDCDIECPDECSVLPEHYSTIGASCIGTTPNGVVTVLSTATGYCGTGEESLELIPGDISLEDAKEAGFSTVQEYLEYANPDGNTCTTSTSICTVNCNQTADDGTPMKNIGCNYYRTIYQPIRDNDGKAMCFNKQSVEDYLQPTVGEVSEKPTPLLTIEASEVRKENGEYDLDLIDEDRRKGLTLLYRANTNTVSFDDLVKEKCHLYKTEECDAPLEDVDCAIGLVTPAADIACVFNGCGQQQYKTLTEEIKTQPFGDGTLCQLREDPVYNVTPTDCPTSTRCCEDSSDYVASGVCKSDGKMTYNLSTTSCDNSTTELASTKEVNCCYEGSWAPVSGYAACEFIDGQMKRKHTRVVNNCPAGTATSSFEVTNNCNYDCQIAPNYENNMTSCQQVYNTVGAKCGTMQHRAIDYTTTRDPKGNGKSCNTVFEDTLPFRFPDDADYFWTSHLQDDYVVDAMGADRPTSDDGDVIFRYKICDYGRECTTSRCNYHLAPSEDDKAQRPNECWTDMNGYSCLRSEITGVTAPIVGWCPEEDQQGGLTPEPGPSFPGGGGGGGIDTGVGRSRRF